MNRNAIENLLRWAAVLAILAAAWFALDVMSGVVCIDRIREIGNGL